MSGFGIGNLTQALAQHTRQIAQDNWQVGSGATTTVLPVVLRNPSGTAVNVAGRAGQDLVGATAEFVSGANIGSSRAITAAANDGTLTLDTELNTAPASGDLFVVIKGNVTATASENISQVGGTTQTGADWTMLFQGVSNAVGTPGSAAPANATQMGGTDGTDLRVLVTDSTGVAKTMGAYSEAKAGAASPVNSVQVSNFPTSFSGILASGTAIAADGELATSFTVPANGTVVLSVTLASGAVSSVLQVSRNASASTPFWANLNNGTTLTAGNEFDANIPVASGDVVNLRLVTATTLGWAEFFFVFQQ